MIDNFLLATGARVMKRAIPVWRAKVAGSLEDKSAKIAALEKTADKDS